MENNQKQHLKNDVINKGNETNKNKVTREILISQGGNSFAR